MLYTQTCMIGLAILLIPLLNRHRMYGRDWQLFRAVIIVVMLDMLFETSTWKLNGRTFSYASACVYASNLLTILLQPVMGLLWLYYTLEKIGVRLPRKSPLHILCAAPLSINVLLLLTNYWTHAVFIVTPDNYYLRADLLWISVTVSFLYPAAATALALAAARKAESSAKKRDCYVLASFLIPPVIAAILQLIFYGTFLFLIGFAISLLIVFTNLQNERITVDFLTRVNNRASFIDYFDRKVRSVKAGCSLYLFMIDVDFFKRINDTYGHIAGDQVLIAVAEHLKRVCSDQKCILARLGGDEFGILLECKSMQEAGAFAERIRASLDDFNSDSNLADPVTLSVGYATCEAGMCSFDKLVSLADGMMYREKAKRHMVETQSKRARNSAEAQTDFSEAR